MSTDKRVLDLGATEADRQVSAFELARYHAGELTNERRQQVESLLANDPSLSAELEELRASDAAFRVSMPFDRFVADHDARKASSSGWAGVRARLRELRFPLGGGVLAAAAAAIALALFVPGNEMGTGDINGISGPNRLKGAEAGIGFFVKADEGARWGNDGERLRAGDRIQFAVKQPESARSMVIVGVDGRGEVSTYLARRLPTGTPKGGDEGAPLLLEQSLVLDDAVGAERFFVVYGSDDDVDAVRDASEAAARQIANSAADLSSVERLPLTLDDVQQGSVHILKVPR